MRRVMLTLAVVLAACGGATPEPRPTEVPTPTPTPRSDIAAQITKTIDISMCAELPSPGWCKYLRKTNGLYDVKFADGVLAVGTVIPDTAKGMKLAGELCDFLGFAHYDDNGVGLGYSYVEVYRGSLQMAGCPTSNRK
jgi:hypothetical protein